MPSLFIMKRLDDQWSVDECMVDTLRTSRISVCLDRWYITI